MVALLLLLSTVGALFSSGAQEAYNQLPDDYKKGVDLSQEKLHSLAGIQQHFLFFKSVRKSEIKSGFDVKYIYHHFYLKATRCPKGTTDASGCQFRNDRPLIDCGVCYKTYKGGIEQQPKPYIHCVHRTALTDEMKESRVQHCNTQKVMDGFG